MIWELKCLFSYVVQSNHVGERLQEALLLYDVLNSNYFSYPDSVSNEDPHKTDHWVIEQDKTISMDPSDQFILTLCCILSIEYFAEIENISEKNHLNGFLNFVREDYQKHLFKISGVKSETLIDHLNYWSDVLELADFNIRNVGGMYCLLNGDDLSFIYHTIDKNVDVPNISI